MDSIQREEYVKKLQAKLDEWNAQIDELEAKAKQRKALREQRNAERLAQLKRQRDAAREKLEEIKNASGDAWESLKSGAETVWNDITRTFEESKKAFVEGMEQSQQGS